MTTVIVIEGLVIAGLVVLVAGLLRSHADILRRLHRLDADQQETPLSMGATRRPSPPRRSSALPEAIAGSTPDGRTASIALNGNRGHTLVAFLSSGCGTCASIWSALEQPESELAADRVVIVTKSAEDESLSAVRRLAPTTVTTILSTQAWRDFEVPYTPYFALIDAATGTLVGDGAAGSWQQIVSLVERSLGDSTHRSSFRRSGRSTRDRLEDSAEELHRSGIDPGDPVLYRRPGDGG